MLLSNTGVHLEDVYIAEGRVLMGSARAQKEAEALRLRALKDLQHEQVRRQLETDIAELQARSVSVIRELEAKRRQALFHDTSENMRLEQESSSALNRRALRTPNHYPRPDFAPGQERPI